MREIKFRGWHLTKKIMREIAQVNTHALQCKPSDTHDLWTYGDWKAIGRMKNCELMQYTGLKDKKGKEIYEGDKIKCSIGIIIVTYPFLELWDKKNYGEEFEVIGNIYENPELVE